MLLYPEDWHYGYEQIKTDCQASDAEGQSVLLLCNADVDAIASARIVSYMLRSDGIHYQLLPCTNYAALNLHLRTVQLDSVRAIVLLNFGACRNLGKLLEDQEGLHERIKVYVLDCRRPVHLANVHAGDNVVVFMDGTQNMDQLPSDGDNLSGNESPSDEEENSEGSSDDDDESDDDDDGDNGDEFEEEAVFDDVVDATKSKPAGGSEDQSVDYDGEDEGENRGNDQTRRTMDDNKANEDGNDDDFTSESPAKRQRTDELVTGTDGNVNDEGATDVEQSDPETSTSKDNGLSPRELHRHRRERLRSYYNSGSFYGSPAAFVAYQIAQQLRFGEQEDLLWLACVGVTDAYLHSRVDMIGYTEMAMGLKQSCLKLFPTDNFAQAINTVYAEDLTGTGTAGDKTKITFSDNGRIVAENDYRFFLLRHSSLFDSMVHSDYISTKLQIWTKKGMHRLQEMLARMGYPLEECKQPFAFMKPSLRRRLHDKIKEQAEVSFIHRITPGYYPWPFASDGSSVLVF